MTDSPRHDGVGPTQPPGSNYRGYPDPAYASQAPYGPPYQPPVPADPTQRLPPAYQYGYGYDPYATGQYGPGYPPPGPPPPQGPKSPRWLWAVAAIAVLLVVGLVIALVIANSSRQQTVVAPAPSVPEPTATSTPRPTTTTTAPSPTAVLPVPTTTPPSDTTTTSPSGATETVTYNVTGEGRVINITYTDTGGVPQTEFNVELPWSKQVELRAPAEDSARISVINVGNDVTCSVTINGRQVEQRTGSGLTFCVGNR